MNAIGARTLEYLRGEKDLFEERKRVAELRKKVEASNLSYWMTGVNKRRVERFWQVVSLLQENSRMTLMEMSKRLKIPVSTLFETVKEVEKHFQFTIVLKDNVKNVSHGDTIAVENPYQGTCELNTAPSILHAE
jgi:choline kinase